MELLYIGLLIMELLVPQTFLLLVDLLPSVLVLGHFHLLRQDQMLIALVKLLLLKLELVVPVEPL